MNLSRELSIELVIAIGKLCLRGVMLRLVQHVVQECE